MNLKKGMIFISLVFILAVWSISQTDPKFSDDRELFIGVAGSGVMPRILILADNSISMRTAMYHPGYTPTLYYNHRNPADQNSDLLTLDFGSGIFGTMSGNYHTLTSPTTFNICGERGTTILNSEYEANFVREDKVKGKIFWVITSIKGDWTAAINKTVNWGCTNTPNSCNTNYVTITGVSGTSPNLIIQVVYANNPKTNPPPNSPIYIKPGWELSPSSPNSAGITPEGTTCASAGYASTIYSNVKLYGSSDDTSVLYDDNYLYWLAFHAPATAVAEVTNWANTGAFKPGSYAGTYRFRVAKDVLQRVIGNLWAKNGAYNFGFADFDSNGEGYNLINNMQNVSNMGNFLRGIENMNLVADAPLAESLADIWAYFKCGALCFNYLPVSLSNPSGCSSYAGENCQIETSCLIQYRCQKNYVIIISSGQSSNDDFTGSSKYDGALFKESPSSWSYDDSTNSDPLIRTSLLDNVAWYLNNEDIFDDKLKKLDGTPLFPDMTGKQNIETFTIGFSVDNELLKETAKNGNGEYYPADDSTALEAALSGAITNIMLRNFAFTSYTAPKRVTTAVGEGASFVGYFMPADNPIWDGHLQSYTIYDKWYADNDANGLLSDAEKGGTPYGMKTTCQSITGKNCLQIVDMAPTPNWDATDKLSSLTTERSLWTLDPTSGTPVPLNFTAAGSIETLHTLFKLSEVEDPVIDRNQTHTIVNTISNKLNFGDVFHSDIAYVGAPLKGKIYLQNYNPTPECDVKALETDADCYQTFRLAHGDRRKVLYVGTNIGIVHMIDANSSTADGGKEIWGFIPDEILPTLKTIAIDKKFAYTADGRMTADDIYCHGATSNPWKTILAFGLKDGGQSFYALDITTVQNSPTFLWKFPADGMDDTYNGNSWSKPIIGKIRYSDGTSSYDRWVVIVSGGRAFNNENLTDNKGKAVFVLDAANGDVIWMIGYNFTNGAADVTTTPELEDNKLTYANPFGHPSGQMHLTKDPAFNYCIPSAISAIDRDNNGYIDSIYFGNVAGNLFKINMANADPTNWKTYLLYQTNLTTPIAAGTITAITAATPSNSYKLTVTSGTFAIGQNVLQEHSDGTTSMGFITDITGTGNKDYWIQTTSDESFVTNVSIAVKPYDPIFLAPAIYTDTCNNYWVNFGTGDRLRSRTNPTSGKFVSIKDGATTPGELTLNELVGLTFDSDANTFSGSTNIRVDGKWGWYFNFPDTENNEKLFDPDPIILPDQNFQPTIYFNTYQYIPISSSQNKTACEACDVLSAGVMRFYQINVDYCGMGTPSGIRVEGRISGGGMMEGSEFIIVEGTSEVGSVDLPGLGTPPKFLPKPMPYTGGLLFWKEKKR